MNSCNSQIQIATEVEQKNITEKDIYWAYWEGRSENPYMYINIFHRTDCPFFQVNSEKSEEKKSEGKKSEENKNSPHIIIDSYFTRY